MFIEYILSIHRDDLVRILSDVSLYNSYSINVDFLNLFEADPDTGDGVLCNPKNTLAKCDKDLIKVQQRILDEESSTSQKRLSVKQNVSARFYGLPVCPELHRSTIPKNKDLGCFLKVAGTAIRVTQSKMLEYRKSYKCLKCQYIQVVEGKYEQRYVIKPPNKCKNSDIQCRSTTFSPVHTVTRENCKDYQELKIQEQVNKLSVGGIPGSIWVTLEDDLVDCCKPGDDVSICGIIMRRWNPISLNKKCDVELVFKANHVEVCNAQKAIAVSIAPDVIKDFDDFWVKHQTSPMKGRDVVLASVCPKVYGLYMVKLALTLTVITGSSHNLDRDNSSPQKTVSPKEDQDRSVRGQCHLLLVGDPGTGKSQLLKAGAMMTSRSVLTSGSGSTKAGLTCTALREDGEWQLEAGALVLADGGACCIDELAQMREHDRASIHEAMEQQTISVAKAGIICKLNTRCAVIAACNPKGNYDTEQALSVNVSLGTPLLSRFDLIFILLDTLNQEWDNLVADYVLFGKTTEAKQHPKSWSLEKLQLYISLIGPYEVSISSEANSILRAYYVRQRRAENRDPSRTTVRMLDSLVRLSQAHARLMFRHVVLPMDAITAVSLMDLSMQDCTLSDTSNALHSTFSEYPDFEYLKTAKDLLSTLNLYEIWHNELSFYSKLLNVNVQLLEKDLDNGETKYFPHNISIDESSHLENASEIVESSFFKQPSKAVDNVEKISRSDDKNLSSQSSSQNITSSSINKLSKTFLETEKDDDLDSILDFNDSISLPKKLSIKAKGKANESISIEKLVGKAEGKSIPDIDNVNTKLSVDRLAQTLKKHSTMNKITNLNSEGIITGKRKRETNKCVDKSKKAKKRISIDAPLQNILNEINQVCDKQNSKTNKVKKSPSQIKKKGVSNKFVAVLPNSDEEINETEMLKCLPSVNDVFNDISTEFDQIDYESDASMFENSLPLQENYSNNKQKLNTRDTVKCNSKIEINDGKNVLKASETVLDESLKKRDKKEIEQKISPVNLKTMEKLQQFCFSSNKKKDDKTDSENSALNASLKSLNRVIDFPRESSSRLENETISSNFIKDIGNVVNSRKLQHQASQASSSNGPSQISIFENDDFDVLDI